MRGLGFFVLGPVALMSSGCSASDREVAAPGDAGAPTDASFVGIVPGDGAASCGAGGAEVFGHSDTALYRLDPETKAVTVVGNFKGCYDILDIALDEDSNLYGASETGLFRIDRCTATCTLLKEGKKYPNSLSFVPKGTLDPNQEVLVGFINGEYHRIDTVTGETKFVGTLSPTNEYRSSGDIVSVKNGGTFVTVLGNGCHDCLAEIDPVNGRIKKTPVPLPYADVFGLTFWGGSAYGFTNGGELFEIKFIGGAAQVGTSGIPIPVAPSGLKFWGAGSTTSAPLTIR